MSWRSFGKQKCGQDSSNRRFAGVATFVWEMGMCYRTIERESPSVSFKSALRLSVTPA